MPFGHFSAHFGPILHIWRPLQRVPNEPKHHPQSHCIRNFILESVCYETVTDQSKKCPKIPKLKIQNFSTSFLRGQYYPSSDELRVPRRSPNLQFSYAGKKMAFRTYSTPYIFPEAKVTKNDQNSQKMPKLALFFCFDGLVW